MIRIKTTTLQRSAYIATIVAASVSVIALLYGTYQFGETQKHQRETLELEQETKAVELFIKYNELMRDATGRTSRESEEAKFWRYNLSIAIAESIWNLTNGNLAWENTVKGILLDQDRIKRIDNLDCSTYNLDFIQFTGHALEHAVCSQ